ncbi:hypothetical protein VU08_06260 [Desulfobulbus sp. F5]|nr:hypothetical protein [Desulfobulbus sp. F5]
MRQFRWNHEKNLKLSEERGISFETIVYAIRKGDVIDVVDMLSISITTSILCLLSEKKTTFIS